MPPPPPHKPAGRPFQFAADVFDPDFRRWESGSWQESPIALIGEIYTWLRIHPQHDLQPLLAPLRRCLQRENPQLLSRLSSLTLLDFKKPWE